MSTETLSGLAAAVFGLIVVGALCFGLVQVRNGKLAWGGAVLVTSTVIAILAMFWLYY